MNNSSDFIKQCMEAPRINEMSEFFSSTASGKEHYPLKQIETDTRLFTSYDCILFSEELTKNSGPFVNHYFCSIPYSKEEECRLGTTIVNYSKRHQYSSPLKLYCLGMAEGAMARTISQLSEGRVVSLTSSPTKENEISFMTKGCHKNSYFAGVPFFKLPNLLNHKEYELFHDGFDIIIEDTTFQMYSPDRKSQIEFVMPLLKKDGLFIFTEKFKTEINEYQSREIQKDISFKRRYFPDSEIESKKEIILNRMNKNEVSIEELFSAVSKFFKYSSLYWNSGNFGSVVASNSKENIVSFLRLLSSPAIPHEYIYHSLSELRCQKQGEAE